MHCCLATTISFSPPPLPLHLIFHNHCNYFITISSTWPPLKDITYKIFFFKYCLHAYLWSLWRSFRVWLTTPIFKGLLPFHSRCKNISLPRLSFTDDFMSFADGSVLAIQTISSISYLDCARHNPGQNLYRIQHSEIMLLSFTRRLHLISRRLDTKSTGRYRAEFNPTSCFIREK